MLKERRVFNMYEKFKTFMLRNKKTFALIIYIITFIIFLLTLFVFFITFPEYQKSQTSIYKDHIRTDKDYMLYKFLSLFFTDYYIYYRLHLKYSSVLIDSISLASFLFLWLLFYGFSIMKKKEIKKDFFYSVLLAFFLTLSRRGIQELFYMFLFRNIIHYMPLYLCYIFISFILYKSVIKDIKISANIITKFNSKRIRYCFLTMFISSIISIVVIILNINFVSKLILWNDNSNDEYTKFMFENPIFTFNTTVIIGEGEFVFNIFFVEFIVLIVMIFAVSFYIIVNGFDNVTDIFLISIISLFSFLTLNNTFLWVVFEKNNGWSTWGSLTNSIYTFIMVFLIYLTINIKILLSEQKEKI